MLLKKGDKAPDFSLVSHEGEEIVLHEVLAEAPVALVFFPLAFSGICTGELCEIRDNLSIFADKKVRVIGISVDSKFALKAWAEQENYDFTLVSDFFPLGEVARAYGVFAEDKGFATRATFVINQSGVIHAAFENPPGEARDFASYKEALESL